MDPVFELVPILGQRDEDEAHINHMFSSLSLIPTPISKRATQDENQRHLHWPRTDLREAMSGGQSQL